MLKYVCHVGRCLVYVAVMQDLSCCQNLPVTTGLGIDMQ